MPGDNIYKTFPNLYTIRGTTHRDVIGWVSSLDKMRSYEPEYIFPSHTKPIIGSEDTMEALTIYRDAIQYVHDQTIRLMNEGYYPDQIIEMVELPASIKSSPYLSEFYGTVRWSVKSIFNGYLGWFNGNPADLDPLSRKEEAQRLAKLVGGEVHTTDIQVQVPCGPTCALSPLAALEDTHTARLTAVLCCSAVCG